MSDEDSVEKLLAGKTLAELRAFCATTAEQFRQGHEFTADAREQTDKVLVWLTGLMGAGIFSVQSLLEYAPLSMRLTAFLPWTAGIVAAMVSRFLSGELQNKNDVDHFGRMSRLALLQLDTDEELITMNLKSILKVDANTNTTIHRLLRWTNWAFYVSHACFAVGVIGAVTAIIRVGR